MVDGTDGDPGGKNPDGSSGAPDGANNPPSKDEPPKKPDGDWVAHDTYTRTLNQKKTTDEENKALRERLAEIDKQDKSRKEGKLKKDGEFQKIIELRDKELKEKNEELSDYKQHFVDSKKLSAFFDAMGGARIADEYLCHIDTDRIVVNPDTGEIDKTSVAKLAEEFKKKHARIIDTPGKGSRLPSDAPHGDKGLSIEEWKKLPLKERKAKMAAVHQNMANQKS